MVYVWPYLLVPSHKLKKFSLEKFICTLHTFFRIFQIRRCWPRNSVKSDLFDIHWTVWVLLFAFSIVTTKSSFKNYFILKIEVCTKHISSNLFHCAVIISCMTTTHHTSSIRNKGVKKPRKKNCESKHALRSDKKNNYKRNKTIKTANSDSYAK